MKKLPHELINWATRFCAIACLTPGLHAQESASPEEIVDLSPFTVTGQDDDGWVAGSTLSGTRTRQAIQDLPISIDAVTVEFLDDVGAYDLDEASKWIAGLDTVSQTDTSLDSGRTSFRGLELGDRDNAQSSRNLFTWFPRTDNYNVERIDFNKGSNSLMFGDSSPGGLAAVYTKRAQNRDFGEVRGHIDSNDGYRFTLDLNRVITDNFYIRLNVVGRDQGSYLDFAHDKLNAYSIATTYKPFEHTIIRFEYEDMDFERQGGNSGLEVNQRAARGRGFTSSSDQMFTSDGEYYDPRTRLFYSSDGKGGFLEPFPIASDDRRNGATGDDLSLAGGSFSHQIRDRDTDDPKFIFGPVPIEVNPNDRNTDRPVKNVSFWIEQRLGDLTVELAFNRQRQEQTWIGNDYGDFNLEGNGRVFVESKYDTSQFGNEVNNARLTAAYPLHSWRWKINQLLVGTWAYMDDEATSFRRRLVNRAKAFDATTGAYDFTVDLRSDHRIEYRAYFDPDNLVAEIRNEDWLKAQRYENLPYVPGIFEPIWVERTTANRPFTDKRYTRTFSLSSSGTLFTDKLNTLVGVRHDSFTLKRYILPEGTPEELIAEYGELAWWGQDVYVGSPNAAPQQYRHLPEFDISDTTFSSGLSYQVTKDFNLYANLSTSFRWQGTENFLGELLGPQTGETVEVGFKANFFKRKLTLSAAAYEVKRENVAFRFDTGNNADELEELFNDGVIDIAPDGTMTYIPASEGDPGFVEIARGFNSEHRQVTAGETSKGYELTLSTKRMSGFRARLALAYIDIKSTRDLSKYAALVALAEERAAARALIIEANWPNDPTFSPGSLPGFEEDLREYLEDAQDVIAFNSGTGDISGSRARPWRISYNLDYKFPKRTLLKNVRVMVSGKWSDDYIVDINDGIVWYGGATHPIDATIYYETKILGKNTRFWLRVRDIVDFENPDRIRVKGGFVDRYTDEQVLQYRNVSPISWELGVRVKF